MLKDVPTKSSKTVSKRDLLAPRLLDFSKAARGKYYKQMQEGTNVVLIAPDLLDTFPDSKGVNDGLCSLKQIAERTRKAS